MMNLQDFLALDENTQKDLLGKLFVFIEAIQSVQPTEPTKIVEVNENHVPDTPNVQDTSGIQTVSDLFG